MQPESETTATLDEGLPPGETPESAGDEEPTGLLRQGVRIGGLRLLFDFAATSRLSEMVPIVPVPAAPRGLVGLASLHGSVLPVFDLVVLAGLEREFRPPRTLLLVVGHGESAAAVLIDGLPDRLRVEPADRSESSPVPEWIADCVAASYARDDEVWHDVNHARLLAKFEEYLRAPL